MSIEFTSLSQVLKIMGTLDDSPGDDTPRERFRRFFLRDSVKKVGQVRDYVEECLRETGSQYDRALHVSPAPVVFWGRDSRNLIIEVRVSLMGVGIPYRAPIATTAPLRKSISVLLPFARSWSMDEW